MADQVSNAPLIVDEAMQRREWEESRVHYPSGATVAGKTGYMFETSNRVQAPARRIADPAVATANILMLPVTFPLSQPWRSQQVSPGVQLPATYTAQPPLE
jgi:hypothetical protein